MLYEKLTQKQRRTIERDVETLFSRRAFIISPTFEDIKRLGPFHPNIRYGPGTLFLSDKGVAALRRITSLLGSLSLMASSVSMRDIDVQVLGNYKSWLERDLQPTGREFTEGIVNSLVGIIMDYEFLIQIEGIDLKDQDILHLGSIRIQRSNRAILENVKFEGHLELDSIFEQFKNDYWLIGQCSGSADIASERFEYRAVLTVGILAVCGAVLYRGAIWRSRVRAVTSPFENRKAVVSLRWEVGGDNPAYSQRWGIEQDLPIEAESVSYLTEFCFLHQLASLPDKANRDELQDAIVRSLYWFAEAYRDRNPTMQFIKLWSCAECFFAIKQQGETESKKITELNARGIASILAFAGYQIVSPQEYPAFKRRVKYLYDLRSKAVHRAEFRHIETADLDDLSHWVAWVIISMVALSDRGYEKLWQVYEQTSRLDRISSESKEK
ncbi:MAG TPA: hypothetical protein VN374_03605 [Desulfitobacteriaceae bacterium]|nr:hypothetical protein [Desulfitobacteriaceae bacterium]